MRRFINGTWKVARATGLALTILALSATLAQAQGGFGGNRSTNIGAPGFRMDSSGGFPGVRGYPSYSGQGYAWPSYPSYVGGGIGSIGNVNVGYGGNPFYGGGYGGYGLGYNGAGYGTGYGYNAYPGAGLGYGGYGLGYGASGYGGYGGAGYSGLGYGGIGYSGMGYTGMGYSSYGGFGYPF